LTDPADPGLFVISIDVEMAWGAVHHGTAPVAGPLYDQERRSVAALLTLMERHEISATWAVVGHLFLDRCERVDGKAHPEVRRAPYPWFGGDWFDVDPATTLADDPWWYGADLVEAIKASAVPQEVGSHSFSHQIVGEPAYDGETFRSELAASRQSAAAAGVELRSFVYPRNSIGHREVLAEQGFSSYRGPTPPRFTGRPGYQRRALAVVDAVAPMASTAVFPSIEADLCNVPQTYLFDPGSRLAQRMGKRWWPRVIGRRLTQAAKHSSLFHLWFHSHDIAQDPELAIGALETLFTAADRLRDRGMLLNLTMGEVAERMQDTAVEQ
jgi:hypothetical protein